jgi:hypothetical protein
MVNIMMVDIMMVDIMTVDIMMVDITTVDIMMVDIMMVDIMMVDIMMVDIMMVDNETQRWKSSEDAISPFMAPKLVTLADFERFFLKLYVSHWWLLFQVFFSLDKVGQKFHCIMAP